MCQKSRNIFIRHNSTGSILAFLVLLAGIGIIINNVVTINEMDKTKSCSNNQEALLTFDDAMVNVDELSKSETNALFSDIKSSVLSVELSNENDNAENVNTLSEDDVEKSVENTDKNEELAKEIRSKFVATEINKEIEVKTTDGVTFIGNYVLVVGDFLIIKVDNKTERINKNKLRRRDRIKYFPAEYVKYHLERRLKK